LRKSLPAALLLSTLLAGQEAILAPGQPPLTEKLVWEYTMAMGNILDVRIDPADIDFFRESLKANWAAKQSLRLQLIEGKRQIDNLPSGERAAGLARIRPAVLATLERGAQAGDREAAYLLAKLPKTATAAAPSPDDAKLDALLKPRNQNDARLDTDGILENTNQSTHPPRTKPSSDAFANLLNEMNTQRSYLTEGDLRKMIRYFEWSLEVPLVNSERNDLRRRLIALHDRNGGQDAVFLFLRQGIGVKIGEIDMSYLDDPFHDDKRRALQKERIPQLRRQAEEGHDLARWLFARYQAAHPALTPGPQALTPHVARIYAEHVVFALNEVVGQPVFAPSHDLTKALLKRLLAGWTKLSDTRRQQILDLPFDWANTKSGWPTRPEHEKTEMRLAWGREFSAAFPQIQPMHDARVAELAKAKAKLEAERQKQSAAEAARLAKLTPEQRAQEFINNQMMAAQLAMMGFQQRMQMQQQTIDMMRSAQLQSHVTNMNIAENIGGGNATWRIVYR